MQHYEDPNAPSHPGMAPPSDAARPYLAKEQSGWPKTIGILIIVFGALAALQGGLGVAAQVFAANLADLVGEEESAAIDATRDWRVLLTLEQLARLALGILAIVGGAKLIGCNASGARLSRTWAILKLVVVGYALCLGIASIEDQMVAMELSAEMQPMPFGPETFETIIQATLVGYALWGAVLPLFVLGWFARGKIKAEVATWSLPQASPPTAF